jgi:hypothetical protein
MVNEWLRAQGGPCPVPRHAIGLSPWLGLPLRVPLPASRATCSILHAIGKGDGKPSPVQRVPSPLLRWHSVQVYQP